MREKNKEEKFLVKEKIFIQRIKIFGRYTFMQFRNRTQKKLRQTYEIKKYSELDLNSFGLTRISSNPFSNRRDALTQIFHSFGSNLILQSVIYQCKNKKLVHRFMHSFIIL
jgi:hypothetical protein